MKLRNVIANLVVEGKSHEEIAQIIVNNSATDRERAILIEEALKVTAAINSGRCPYCLDDREDCRCI